MAFIGYEINDGREEDTDNIDENQYLDHYSRTKKRAEDIVRKACKEGLLKTCIFRFVTVWPFMVPK